MTEALIAIVVLIALWIFLRPKLDASPRQAGVPALDDLRDLSAWLDARERAVPDLVDGAAAHIRFANPDAPARTPLAFVYLHGFSATWPETAPVTERLAARFGANVLQARLAGHGVGSEGMLTPAEAWLDSVQLSWEVASQLGERVVIVATSTGAPLAVWLASQPALQSRIHALLFMSPNFGIRSPFDFLLTAPGYRFWIRALLGAERYWEPVNDAQARYWTNRYSNLALTEMQKVVDWTRKQDLGQFRIPLATMVMENDPTISPRAAVRAHEKWGGTPKSLIPIEIDPTEPSHVFVGDITAPHRTDWVVEQFAGFVESIPPLD